VSGAAALIQIAHLFLKLANGLFQHVRDEKLTQLGEDRANGRALLALNRTAALLKEIDERFDKMSDAEIKASLEGKGDFRD